jgi:hypothetical protein
MSLSIYTTHFSVNPYSKLIRKQSPKIYHMDKDLRALPLIILAGVSLFGIRKQLRFREIDPSGFSPQKSA